MLTCHLFLSYLLHMGYVGAGKVLIQHIIRFSKEIQTEGTSTKVEEYVMYGLSGSK